MVVLTSQTKGRLICSIGVAKFARAPKPGNDFDNLCKRVSRHAGVHNHTEKIQRCASSVALSNERFPASPALARGGLTTVYKTRAPCLFQR